ncbi:MAG: pyridoxal-dependent decarboxylase [Bacteroidota bacterium]|jgi:glutamate/tyrosine decarboxylase-like PLP-dependent enzyme|nr:MAG: aspartate aminotransferase family protein [Bacteroidota bacterium]
MKEQRTANGRGRHHAFNIPDGTLLRDKMLTPHLLALACTSAAQQLERQRDLHPGVFVGDLPLQDLPEEGAGAEAVLNLFVERYAEQISNSAGPRYFGFVTGGSTPASVIGDWMVSTLDQNPFGSTDSIAPQIERQAIHYLKQLLNIDEAYFGSFVTGATMSNFVGIATARQWIGEQRGHDYSIEGITGAEPIQVLSGSAHSSIYKVLSMAGIGRNAVVKIKNLPGREAMDVADLERHLQRANGPVIVSASAGTVNTVDFDDLEAIGRLKKRYKFWMHVDGAFGGFAGCSPRYAHLTRGINYADSITVDAHKWLNVPYDSAMHFTRHQAQQGKVFQNQAAYLGGDQLSPDFLHYTPENSRRFRALPAWFTLLAYGRSGHAEIVERNCALASLLGEYIERSRHFRLLAPVRMNVVCFTLKGQATQAAVHELMNAVRDDGRAYFSPTVFEGIPALRAAVSNWQTEEKDIQIAFEALEELAARSSVAL